MLRKIILTLIAAVAYHMAIAQNTNTVDIPNDNVDVYPDVDSVQVTDPVTGKMSYKKTYSRMQLVSYKSGKQIFKEKEATEPVAKAAQESIDKFFRELFADELGKTKESFDFMMILINENGKIDLFNTDFLTERNDEMHKMRNGMWKKLENLTFIPAKKDGTPVPYLVTIVDPNRKTKE